MSKGFADINPDTGRVVWNPAEVIAWMRKCADLASLSTTRDAINRMADYLEVYRDDLEIAVMEVFER